MPRYLLALLGAVVVATGMPLAALAADPPNTAAPSVGFDGDVEDVAVSGATAYVAGDFSSAGESVGSLMLSDAATGARLPALPPVDGLINAVLPDGTGGWFIGGSWRQIGGQRATGNVAHLLADGSVDPAFRAPPMDDDVEALALWGAPARLVAGGRFRCVGGDGDGTCGGGGEPAGEVSQHALTALSTTTGAAEPAFFGDAGLNATVEALDRTATRLIVGGGFACAAGDADSACGGGGEPIGEVPRRGLAAYTPTGVLDGGWSPDIYRVSGPYAGVAHALAVTADQVIVGGVFDCAAASMTVDADCTDATEVARRNVAAFRLPGSGDLVRPYAPEAGGAVLAIAATATRVFLGGTFECLKTDGDPTCGGGGEPADEVVRNGLAATQLVDAATIEPWDPRLDAESSVNAVLPAADGIYVTGFFTCTQTEAQPRCDDPGEVPRRNAAAFDPVSGATLGWNPSLGQAGNALARAGSGPVAIAGDMKIAAAVARVGLAAVDLRTGALLPWDPLAGQNDNKQSVSVLALSPDARTLYAGASKPLCAGYDGDLDCGDPGEVDLGRLIAVDTASGTLSTSFTPRPDGPPYRLVSGPDGTLYLTGIECLGDLLGGCAGPSLAPRPGGSAAVSAAGAVLPWAPMTDLKPVDLAVAGGAVYAVGRFACAGGTDTTCGNEPGVEQTRLRAAAFDAVSGAVLPWNPAASVGLGQPLFPILTAVEPDLARGRILIAGSFACLGTSSSDADCTDPGEVTRRGVAGVDPATGAPQQWGPGSLTGTPASPGEQTPITALALTADRETVVTAGNLTSLDGQPRERYGSLAAGSGAAAGWNPGGLPAAFGLATAPGVTIAHGAFSVAGGSIREGLALFGVHPPVIAETPSCACGGARDVTRPVISRLRVGRRFSIGKGLVKIASARRKVPVGTTVRFTMSEDAKVRLAVARKVPGRRSGKRCVAPGSARRGAKRCVRLVAVKGSATVAGRRGANRVAFAGRLSRRAVLRRGEHLLTLVATDAAGNRSAPRTAAFALVRASGGGR